MAASSRRDLFLQVSANIDNLQAAMKAGRSVLNEFGTAANDTTTEVQKAFEKLGGGSVEASAKAMETSYTRAFANIRANAQAVLSAPTPQAAVQVVNVAGAEQAAAAAEAQAASLRLVADAAQRAAAGNQDNAAAAHVYAAAATAAALGAEEEAAALRAQAGVLAGVRAQLGPAADAEKELAVAHGRMGASGMIAEHVVRSMSDSIAAGQSPVRALTMEMGRITEALTFFAAESNATEGVAGKFASFMGGPWGIAISVAVAVLGPLVAELLSAGKASEEAAKSADEHKRAIDALVKSEADAILSTEAKLRRDWEEIESERQKAVALRETLAAKLALVRQEFASARTQTFGAGGGAGAGMATAAAAGQVSSVKTEIAANKADIARLTTGSIRAAGEYVKGIIDTASTPQGRVGQKYDRLRQDAEREYERTSDLAKYSQTLARLNAAREEELKALQTARAAAGRTARDNRQFGNLISVADAASLVRGIGGQVNSGTRSYAEQKRLYDAWVAQGRPADNPVARPGTSAHERGNALDVQMAPGMSIAKLREVFAQEGVALTKAIVERGHYHIEWGKQGPSQEALDRRQQAGVTRDANDDRAYQAQLGQAQDRYARAQLSLADTAEGRYDVEIAELRAAKTQRDLEINDQVTAKKINGAQADKLKKLNADTEALGEQSAQRRRQQADLDRHLASDRQQLDAGLALLNLQAALATTYAERRRIALQILAKEEQEATLVADRDIASDDPARHDRGVAAKSAIAEQHAARLASAEKQTADPVQSYREQLRGNVGNMNDALKGVEADGLKGLEDGLTGIIDGTESVSGAFKKMAASIISDLARIAVEKLILGVIGLKDGGVVPSSGVLHLAGGGKVFGSGGPREDRVPAMLSAGEYVVNAAAYARNPRLVEAINTGKLLAFADGGLVPANDIFLPALPSARSMQRGGGTLHQHFDLRGAMVDRDVYADIHRISAGYAAKAVVGGSHMAQQEMAERQFQAIPS